MNSDAENIQNEIGIEELEKSNDSSLKSDNHAESIETPYVEELTNETKKKTRMALEQLEMMIMKQSSGGNGLDISKLSEKQRDKVIDLMHKNEDNAFSYAKEKLRVTELPFVVLRYSGTDATNFVRCSRMLRRGS